MNRHKSSDSNASGGNGINLTLAFYSQSESQKNVDAVLYFVIPKGSTEKTCTPKLMSAYQLCHDFELNAVWITEDNLRKTKPKYNNVFVVDPFSGSAFSYIEGLFTRSKKFVIIGPQCIHYSIQRQETNSQIQSRGFPFYTMGMQNICVCLTGFKPDVQNELVDLVQKMNGIVSKPYSVATTHVVAAHVLTPKCREAYKNDVLVMSEDWIRNVWADSQNEIIDATDAKYIKYTCKLFHNVNICVSQVPSSLKKNISNIITAGDGIYSRDFTRNQTQVLIVPTASGDKYNYAKQWEVPCVTPDWVTQSKDAGHVLPFDNFKPERRPAMSSTQINGETDVHLPDFSNITSMSSIGVALDQSRVIANSTRFTDSSMLSVVEKEVNNEIVRKSEIEILRKVPTGFLDGCTIYLCNHDNEKLNELRIILNGSGATRLSAISNMITHVVVINGHVSDAEIKAIKNLNSQPHILSMPWLLECASAGHAVKEEPFEIELQSRNTRISNNSFQSVPSSSMRNRQDDTNTSGNKSQEGTTVKRNSSGSNSSLTINPEPDANANDSLEKSVKAPNQSQNSTAKRKSVFYRPESSQVVRDNQYNEEAMYPLKDNNAVPVVSTFTNEESDFVLAGIKFFVNLSPDSEREKVENRIREANGEVLTDSEIDDGMDILILPPIYEPYDFTALQTFTKYWLLEVIAERSLDIPEQVYHVPLVANEKAIGVLTDVVIAISAYSALVKEYITAVASFMGATVQEVFARKDTKGSRKTTHLICNVTSNDKYRAAQRWGTPVVTCDWIIGCYKNRRRLDHIEYRLQENDSDSTISLLTKTPSTQMEKYQKIDKINSVASRIACAKMTGDRSIIPASANPKSSSELNINGFRRPNVPTTVATKLNFNNSLVSSPAAQSAADFSTPKAFKKKVEEPVESPLIHPFMTREGSRQLKRALDLAADSSPSDSERPSTSNKKRKSTPLSKIMKDIQTACNDKIQANLNSAGVASAPKNIPSRALQWEDKDEEEDGGISLALPDGEGEEEVANGEIILGNELEEDNPRSKRARIDASNPKLSSATNSTGYNSINSRKGSSVSSANGKVSSSYLVRTKMPPLNAEASEDKFGPLDDIQGNSEVDNESKIGWGADGGKDDEAGPVRQASKGQGREDKRPNINGKGDNEDEKKEEVIETAKKVEIPKHGKAKSNAVEVEGTSHGSPPKTELQVPLTSRVTRNRGGKPSSSTTSTSSKGSTAGSVRGGRVTRRTEGDDQKTSNELPVVEVAVRFSFSGVGSHDKAHYKQVLEKLGGVMSQIDYYDPATDAVIATKVSRSEKILGAIAAGKPLLHPSFIEACKTAEKLPNVEDYIWTAKQGNTEAEKVLINAAQSWFKKIKGNPQNAPFSKFVALVCEEKTAKREAYKRLIEAGGGRITLDVNEINILVGEGAEAKRIAAQRNVPVKIPMFLNNVIINFDYDGVDELLGISD